MGESTKNVRNPHIFHTILHILRTLEILQFFEIFNFFPLENTTVLFIDIN